MKHLIVVFEIGESTDVQQKLSRIDDYDLVVSGWCPSSSMLAYIKNSVMPILSKEEQEKQKRLLELAEQKRKESKPEILPGAKLFRKEDQKPVKEKREKKQPVEKEAIHPGLRIDLTEDAVEFHMDWRYINGFD